MQNTQQLNDDDVLTMNVYPRRMSLWKLILFSFFPIAMTSCFTFSLTILLPLQLIEIVGNDSKATALGVIGALRAISTVISGVVFGYVSDHTVTRFGKRMPLIVIGTIVNALLYISRVFFNESNTLMLVLNGAALILGDTAGQIVMTCYMSLFPDLFVSEQMGLLSGMNSFVQLLASAVGVSLMGFLYGTYVPPIVLISVSAAWMVLNSLLLAIFCREPPTHYCSTIQWIDNEIVNEEVYDQLEEEEIEDEPFDSRLTIAQRETPQSGPIVLFLMRMKTAIIDIISTFKSWNFVWLFVTRCLFTLCLGIVQAIG
jgi:Na+/melibiose symporter-like transporter